MAERVIGLLVVMVAVAYWWLADNLPLPLLRQAVGPEAFPKLVALFMGAMGALLIIGPVWRRRSRGAADPTPAAAGGEAGDEAEVDAGAAVAAALEQDSALPAQVDYRTTALVLLGLAVYPLIYEPLGFMLATFLFLVYEITVMETDRRHWLRTALVSGLTAAAFYFLFVKFLMVTLPAGVLG